MSNYGSAGVFNQVGPDCQWKMTHLRRNIAVQNVSVYWTEFITETDSINTLVAFHKCVYVKD